MMECVAERGKIVTDKKEYLHSHNTERQLLSEMRRRRMEMSRGISSIWVL